MQKILIVDDDFDFVESLKVVLENRGYEVVSAPTGEEGVNKVKEEKPDLVILDVMMETVDRGFKAARELKKNKDSKDIPILMLTAISERVGLDFKKEAGDEVWLPVDEYCEKPLKSDELISKVERLLKSKSGKK